MEIVAASPSAVHEFLQIVTVAPGSPRGREVAPRELSEVLATLLYECAKLSRESRRVLLACGAGAGLASVYSVALGGALFTIEVLLSWWAAFAVLSAMATSTISLELPSYDCSGGNWSAAAAEK